MATQAERRETTRGALIAAARACFLDQGYDATSTEAVLKRAGVSKGALYHHFQQKTDLLAAVFEAVTRETLAHAEAATRDVSSPRLALALGLKAWLRAALAPEPLQVLLRDGPTALGWARTREIEDTITRQPMRAGIERAIKAGEVARIDVELTARLLSAAVGEMALTAAERGVEAHLESMDRQIDALLDALVPAGRPKG